MYGIDKIFAKALEYTLKSAPRGTKARIARQAEITAQKLNDILTCRRGSDEDDRRKLAAALGYPGRQYEDFLDIGRRILAGEDPEPSPVPAVMKEPAPSPEAGGESGNLQEKLAGCLKEIEELRQELETARKRNDKLIDGLLAKDDRLKELIAKREELGAEMLVKDARIQEKDRHIATLLRHIVDNGFEKGLPQDFLTMCAASIEQEDAAHKKNCTDSE